MKLSDLSENRREVLASHGKNDDEVRENIRILREWMSKLPHLPSEKIQDQFLELCLLKNKFSIEKCKAKIENYCTSKANPNYQYVYERIPVPSEEPSTHTPFPVLTDEYKRVVCFKIHNVKTYEMTKDLSLNAILREFLLRYDYNDGEIHILDLRNCSSSVMTKFRLNIYADAIDLIMNGYSARISSIHIVCKIGKSLFSTIIPLLPKKLASRLHFHEDVEELPKVIPSKCLPSDYGGILKSLQEINADWDEVFAENRKLLQSFIDTKSQEELRVARDLKKEEMNGTFKKLNID